MIKLILAATASVMAIAMADTAQAAIESVHKEGLRNAQRLCLGEHRIHTSTLLPGFDRGIDVTGPGFLTLEFFGHGVDLNANGARITGSSAITISSRLGTGGFENGQQLCGNIGSVSLGLRIAAVDNDQTAFVEIGGERYPIRIHARHVINARHSTTSFANYRPGTGTDSRTDCVSRAKAMTINTDKPGVKRIVVSADGLAALRICASTPDELWSSLAWEREARMALEIPDNGIPDAPRVSITRTALAANRTLTVAAPDTLTAQSGGTQLRFKVADLTGFFGSATFDIAVNPAPGGTAPLKVIVDTYPENGVRDVTFGVPASTSTVRTLKVNYSLHRPSLSGTRLKWSASAYKLNASGIETDRLSTCFAQPNGSVAISSGLTNSTVDLVLTDAAGCSDRLGAVTLQVETAPSPDFGASAAIGVKRTFKLPAFIRTTLVNPIVPKTPIK